MFDRKPLILNCIYDAIFESAHDKYVFLCVLEQ